jgi:hypothetical protein
MKKGNASGIVRSSSNRVYTEKKMINYINISQLINERNKQLERFQTCIMLLKLSNQSDNLIEMDVA